MALIDLMPGDYAITIQTLLLDRARYTARVRLASEPDGEPGDLLDDVWVDGGQLLLFDDDLGDAAMTTVWTGFGDVRYPIFEVIKEGRRVGVEIAFIDIDFP
ncbi:hypothetical protein [Tautonia plasticadhaerens]|nr:hypothetical protein [Tautonia plasticadhaerens]